MHECDSCKAAYAVETDLLPTQNLWERLDQNTVVVMPSGECPACGSLCYRVPDETEMRFAENRMLAVMGTLAYGIQADFTDPDWTLEFTRDVLHKIVHAMRYEDLYALKERVRMEGETDALPLRGLQAEVRR